ncbi:hypothetical protein CRE_03548 [Caenorhabditis remanei]|uniref:Carboxylesterase type B domain-containing protein n=1 Tax=Caenorhabditis remanei TaxID=31234 RepID=E3NQA2_CAERE|nr:hypothetical protein CRE_03548 [Caenorhabditis remanei]
MKNLRFILLLAFIKVSISIIISTSYGKLNGKHVGEYHSFKHVPFAKPPIGELRFQKPETVEPWNDVREAVDYGPACMSNSTWTKSPQKWVDEDCLHINIFTSNKCLKSKNCPVAVYIHGGELSFDSAVMFNDTFMFDTFVKRDVVLLVPAFRLGIFSHFVVEDQSIAPTNLALYDILKSFEFVKSEVHNFGGDNKKITVFGHSYGGTISSMLTFSTEINQDLSLFQKSVSMSGHQYFETLELHMERAQRFAKHANCLVDSKQAETMTRSEQDRLTMKCLQAKSGMELLRVQRSLEEAGYSDLKGVVLREPIFPKVKPMELWNSPNKIPMLTGCTKIEFDHEDEVIPLATVFGFDNPKECEEKYRKDLKEGTVGEQNSLKNYSKLVFADLENHTDKTMAITVPTKIRVNKLLENGIPVYLYEFTYPKHAKHADDLYYIMGVHPFQEDENEINLKKVYQNMFINFIKYGHPGDGFEMSNAEKSSYFDVYWNETTGERPQMRNDFEKKVMDYWLKDMMEYDRKITEEKRGSLEKPSLRYTKLDLSGSGMDQSSHLLFLIFMILVVFIVGCFVGKCCSSRKDNLYVKLDGSNFETVNHFG